MVDWESYDVVTACLFLFKQSLLLILGVYFWEFVLSFPRVDFALITRRLKFQWLFVPYLLGRYGLLVTLLTLTIYLHTTKAINCPVLGRMFSVCTTMTVACASTNLMIRTLAIWRNNHFVYWFLVVASLTHWAIVFISAFSRNSSTFDPTRPDSCHFDPDAVMMFCIYTIAFDFVTLALTIFGLHRTGVLRSQPRSMWGTVYEQGVGYFVVAFLVNLPALVIPAHPQIYHNLPRCFYGTRF